MAPATLPCCPAGPGLTARSVLCAIALLVAVPLAGQSTTGSISGDVTDSSRTLASGVTVTATSLDTGLARSVTTDQRGHYRVVDLPPGRYRVLAERAGFSPAMQHDVVVTIGSDVDVDLSIEVAALVETVEVTARSTLLDTKATSVGGIVTTQQIGALPLNGRNFLQLATLQPGVVVSRATGREFQSGFASTQLAVAGARPEYTGYLLDGTNIADISDKAPSSMAGVLLGVDAIREFSVQTHGYSAEFGRAAGGIVSAVTRSGTNDFRGSVFEFYRDSALNARGFFDTERPSGFARNQFGGSLGGPLLRNRLFFFTSYEGLRERRAVTRIARLPDAAAHEGYLPDAAGVLQPVVVEPLARRYLDLLFPIPDGAAFGDGTAELSHAHRDPVNEDFLVAKADWNATANDAFMVRVSRDVSDATISLDHPLFIDTLGTRTTYATAQHQRVVSSSMLNTLRFAFNRTRRTDDVVPTVEIPGELYFTEDPHFGAINILGLTLVGSTGTIPARYDQRLSQLADTFTWSKGDHLWKAGFDWQHYRFGGTSYSRYGGEFRFRDLREFLTLRRSATAQADRFTGNLPGTDTQRDVRQDYVAFFVQDDWRVRSPITVSLGLRYEFVTTPKEQQGRIAGLLSLDDLEAGPRGVTPGAPLFDNPSRQSVAPRLGVAWSPSNDGRTMLRAGYGLFYQPLTVSYYRGTIFRIFPYFAGVDIRQPTVFGPGIQEVLAQGGDANTQRRSEFIFYDAEQPFVQQWHVKVERDLGAGFTAEVGYLGSKGHNLPFYGDPNVVPSEYLPDGRKRIVPGASLRYPSWGRIRTRINVARSVAHVLAAGVRRQLSGGLMFQAAYTLGNARDTWSGGLMGTADFENGAGSATDWWDPEAEWGPANFDIRHTFVANAIYELPWGKDLTGIAAAFARGWHVGGVVQLASGLPFTPIIGFDRALDRQSDADTVQKPDLVGPITYLGKADAWFDVTAFALPPPGYYGNAGRNLLRGPGLTLADLIVLKDVAVGRGTMQFRIEAFNVFNWVNLGLPDASVMFNTDGTYRAGTARITTTATPARQVQLGVKVLF